MIPTFCREFQWHGWLNFPVRHSPAAVTELVVVFQDIALWVGEVHPLRGVKGILDRGRSKGIMNHTGNS